jgi:hypothetical protein
LNVHQFTTLDDARAIIEAGVWTITTAVHTARSVS